MAREPGRIGIPELLVGVPFPVVPLEIVRFATPPQHLQALIYRGSRSRPTRRCTTGWSMRSSIRIACSTKQWRLPRGWRRCRFEAFHLTKRLLARTGAAPDREGGVIDAVVQDAWAGETVQSAVRDYVARTLKR